MATQESDPLWKWFAETFAPGLKDLFDGLTGFLYNLFKGWFTLVAAFWTFVITIIGLTIWAVNFLVTKLANLNLSDVATPAASLLQYYTFMNRFVPLAEAFSGVVIFFDIWLIVTTVRWVKSFIPTISN